MADKEYKDIPKEMFEFANVGEKLSDKKFDTKPIGYFKDAWLRFRKNRASVFASVIILIIILYALLVPLFSIGKDTQLMDTYYAKKGPRNTWLRQFGIADGSVEREFSEKSLVFAMGIGVAAADVEGKGGVVLSEGLENEYQPILKISDESTKAGKTVYNAKIDTYLEVGFIYRNIEQSEYAKIVEWEKETGVKVLYPLIEKNEYNYDSEDANYWYKMDSAGNAVKLNAYGQAVKIPYSEDMVLEDNYKRDENGNAVYYEYVGGGTIETAQYRVRVLYYNYYHYLNGHEPNYLMGTDSQGYDLAYRIANGIQLSLMIAVFVSVINFIIGAIYGAIEGYYGGAIDLAMERIADILAGVPFIVVATLFQIHLAMKVGAIPSLLFAFVMTGWISTAANVRMQFYRFKNQEYVMAARTLGASDARIIWKHIFPNSLGTIITSSVLVIPNVIFSESMLSFLGIVNLGGAERTSLGTLLSDASSIWTNYPHLMIFPAIVISLLMICFNLFGNGLRDAFNPSLRGVED